MECVQIDTDTHTLFVHFTHTHTHLHRNTHTNKHKQEKVRCTSRHNRRFWYMQTHRHTHALTHAHTHTDQYTPTPSSDVCDQTQIQLWTYSHIQSHTWTGTLTYTHCPYTLTLSPAQTHSLHTGWLWLSCNRWWGYCPRPACAQLLWQQARVSQHLGSPGAPDAIRTPTRNTQPGTRAVNPTIGAVQPVEQWPSETHFTLLMCCFTS